MNKSGKKLDTVTNISSFLEVGIQAVRVPIAESI